MSQDKKYKCVNCGEPAAALFKTYGPSILKLTKCGKCKGIVDKYIEYDPVIVMIDLVLMSKEAQRHVMYNTEFKSYWKLLIVLMMLETYGVWRSDSLFNIVVNSICGVQHSNIDNSTVLDISLAIPSLQNSSSCMCWSEADNTDDLFIWEKDFYIKFVSIFAGISAYILTVQALMLLLKPFTNSEVTPTRLLKAFSLSNTSNLLTLPMLVWGTHDTAAATKLLHYSLVAVYSATLTAKTFTVLYECPAAITILVIAASNFVKYSACFYITPVLSNIVT